MTAIGLVIGGLLGIAAGYRGGAVDTVIMRVLDVLIAFPALVLALAIAEGLGPSEHARHLGAVLLQHPGLRPDRAERHAGAARADLHAGRRLSGTGRRRMVLRHVVPNIMPQLLTFSLLGIGVAIILEGALSFLGLGIPLPEAELGEHDRAGAGTLSAHRRARADPERVPVRHRGGAEPPRRRPAGALGQMRWGRSR